MRYIIKSGILFENEKKLAQIKSTFLGSKKTISLSDDSILYETDIDMLDIPAENNGKIFGRIYTLKTGNGKLLMEAYPDYAEGYDPSIVGWPICRVPKIDHAGVLIEGISYLLVMYNSQNYSLQNKKGKSVLKIMHNGISGGWIVETDERFTIQILCALFVFCRYVEQENEFIIV